MSWSLDPNVAVAQPVKAILNILTAASTHQSIKRVVLTSSIGAAPYVDVAGNPVRTPVDEGTFYLAKCWLSFDPSKHGIDT